VRELDLRAMVNRHCTGIVPGKSLKRPMMRLLVIGGLSRSLINFRGPLLQTLRNHGHEVIAVAPADDGVKGVEQRLAAMGIRFEPLPLARGGFNPFKDLHSLQALETLLRRHRPDVLFAYTAKPVIYGGLAARRVGGIRFFPLITGLGYAFTSGGGLKHSTNLLTH